MEKLKKSVASKLNDVEVNYEEWNEVDEFVKQSILGYPSLNSSRFSVLKHVFCVLGNGYDWEDGRPTDVTRKENLILNKCNRREREWEDLDTKLEDHMFDFIDKNIDLLASTKMFSWKDRYNDGYYIKKPCYDVKCMFFKAPDNMTEAWENAFIEFGRVWKSYFWSRNSLHATGARFNRE